MISVNGNEFPWEEGLTVTELFKRKGFTYHSSRIVVRINSVVISDSDYDTKLINDGDDVLALHICAGG